MMLIMSVIIKIMLKILIKISLFHAWNNAKVFNVARQKFCQYF